MNIEIKESNIIVNQIMIDGTKLKKSQLEQFPYIDEKKWVSGVRDGNLNIVCTFSPELYKIIATKRNKCKHGYYKDEMTMLFSTDTRSNRGIILYNKEDKILSIAALRDSFLTCSAFEHIKDVNILNVLNWIKEKPYIANL